jgi:hypothetical protein
MCCGDYIPGGRRKPVRAIEAAEKSKAKKAVKETRRAMILRKLQGK